MEIKPKEHEARPDLVRITYEGTGPTPEEKIRIADEVARIVAAYLPGDDGRAYKAMGGIVELIDCAGYHLIDEVVMPAIAAKR